MEQTNNTAPSNAGKGLGVAGFVISLVALVLYFVVAIVVAAQAILGGGMMLAIIWTIISVLGLGLSAMGMMKASKAGAKKGLAIAGLVIGIIATIMSIRLVFAVKVLNEASGIGKEMIEKMGDDFKNGMEQAMDSLKNEMENVAPADTTAH